VGATTFCFCPDTQQLTHIPASTQQLLLHSTHSVDPVRGSCKAMDTSFEAPCAVRMTTSDHHTFIGLCLAGHSCSVPLFALRRYFVLTGTVLRYYKSERDAAFNPRGVVDVQVSGRRTFPHGMLLACLHPNGCMTATPQIGALCVCALCLLRRQVLQGAQPYALAQCTQLAVVCVGLLC
jgi:hypothetical protein